MNETQDESVLWNEHSHPLFAFKWFKSGKVITERELLPRRKLQITNLLKLFLFHLGRYVSKWTKTF